MDMNRIMQIAAAKGEGFRREMKELSGYETTTTFYSDFTIADLCGGESAVRDTYRRAFGAWKDDHEYLTELVLALNHKIWEHYTAGHEGLAKVYDELWRKADQYAVENLQGEELAYYYRTTD